MRLVAALTVCLSAASSAQAEDAFAFIGKWDCDINVLTITADSYNDGTNTYALSDVTAEGSGYVIRLAPDYVVGLDQIEADTMTYAPSAGGDQFSCFRLE